MVKLEKRGGLRPRTRGKRLEGVNASKSHSPVPLPTATDPDKYRLMFENERVRVYDYNDEPGDKTKVHRHDDFVLYALGPFKRRLVLGDGKTIVREFDGGEILWSEAQSHIGENIGETNTHVLIVELKKPHRGGQKAFSS